VTLQEQLNNDMKDAMRAKDKFKLQVLRMVLSDFKYAMTAKERSDTLDDESAYKVIKAYHKKLKKSYDAFPESEAERRDEIAREIAIVAAYLPPPTENPRP
jgi:uncharacterized protein YqeY